MFYHFLPFLFFLLSNEFSQSIALINLYFFCGIMLFATLALGQKVISLNMYCIWAVLIGMFDLLFSGIFLTKFAWFTLVAGFFVCSLIQVKKSSIFLK